MEPNIIELKQFTVVGLETFGKPKDSEYSTLWDTLFEKSSEIQHMVDSDIAYGIDSYTNDVVTTDTGFYMVGCEVNSFDELPARMSAKTIPANTYAVFTYQGAIDSKLRDTFQYIYHEWLPHSGYIQAGAYDFEKYGADFKGPQDPASSIELYVPIKTVST